MSNLHKKALLGNLSLPPKPPTSHDHSKRVKTKRDYTPLPWSNYFDNFQDIETNGAKNRFRVYIKGTSGPIVFFLHGGGFSALTWSLLSSILVKRIECRCYCLDIRGHGDTHTEDDEDLSIETMSKDVKDIVEAIWKDENPPVLLVGHSMGGALAVHVAHGNYIKNLIALVVIDVVEGSALEALSSMQTFLQGRPKRFASIEQAIEYNVRIGAIRNVESARVSIIGQLRKCSKNSDEPTEQVLMGSQSHAVMDTEIAEEDEEHPECQTSPVEAEEFFRKPGVDQYEWRIDLSKTEKYWKEWFQGLSNMFLNVHTPKLLLLAGVDRLDKDLMVGQMQGKFQMQILPLCGHAVHEDSPEDVADALANFMIRYKFTHALDFISQPRLSC